MKLRTNIAIAALTLALSAPVLAGNTNTANSGSFSGSASTNAGNNQGVTVTGDTVHSGDIPKQAPAIAAPALTTTMTETCMGSTSLGGSTAGFGLTIGSTWRDDECVRRLNARELRAMGFGLAGKELMCDNDEVRASFERVAKMTGNADLLCQASADVNAAANGGTVDTTVYVEPANRKVAKVTSENKPAEVAEVYSSRREQNLAERRYNAADGR